MLIVTLLVNDNDLSSELELRVLLNILPILLSHCSINVDTEFDFLNLLQTMKIIMRCMSSGFLCQSLLFQKFGHFTFQPLFFFDELR